MGKKGSQKVCPNKKEIHKNYDIEGKVSQSVMLTSASNFAKSCSPAGFMIFLPFGPGLKLVWKSCC